MKTIFTLIRLMLFMVLSGTLMAQNAADSLHMTYSLEAGSAKRANYSTLDDLLLQIPGIWVRSTGSPGQYALYRWGNHVRQSTLLLDGHLFSDPWSGLTDLNLIPVEMAEWIEGYTLQNPSFPSPAGRVIRLVTRACPRQPYTRIVYRNGSHQFSSLDVTFAQRLGTRFEIVSEALVNKYGESLENRFYKGQAIHSKLSYRVADWMQLRYSILANLSDLDLPYSQRMETDTLILDTPHRKTTRSDHVFQIHNTFGKVNSVLSLASTSVKHELRDLDFYPQEIIPASRLRIAIDQKVRLAGIFVAWGAGTQKRSVRPGDASLEDHQHDAYLRSDISLFSSFTAAPGLYIHQSRGGTNLLLSALLKKRIRGLDLWAGYHEGLRDPALCERFGTHYQPAAPTTPDDLYLTGSSYQVLPNPSLEPERSAKLEAGIRLKIADWFRAVLTGTLERTEDLIGIRKENDHLIFSNSGNNTIHSLDWTFGLGPVAGFEWQAVLHAENKETKEEVLAESPDLWGRAGIGWGHGFFKEDLVIYVAAGLRFWSGFLMLDPDADGGPSLVTQKSGISMDLKTSFRVIKNALLALEVDQVISQETAFSPYFRMPVRTMRMGVQWELYN